MSNWEFFIWWYRFFDYYLDLTENSSKNKNFYGWLMIKFLMSLTMLKRNSKYLGTDHYSIS